jgi:hypothetical protein
MRRVNKLIKAAKKVLIDSFNTIFSFNDDGFIEALGLNPSDYEVILKDGTIMYDADRALNDSVKEAWKDDI